MEFDLGEVTQVQIENNHVLWMFADESFIVIYLTMIVRIDALNKASRHRTNPPRLLIHVGFNWRPGTELIHFLNNPNS